MKTMRTFTITAVTFGLALTSSIASAEKKHEEKFCSALYSLNESITKLEAMGPSSTIGELKSTLKETRKHSEEVGKEARKMKSPSAKEFTAAADKLKSKENISNDMTVEQAKTQIKDDVQNLGQKTQTLADESGCPGAMPQKPQSSEPSGTQKPSGGQQQEGGGMEGQSPTR